MVKRRGEASGGYTIVEVMMSMLIMGLIASVFVPLILHGSRFFMMHRAKVEIQRDARVCLDTLNRNIRQGVASTVVIDQATGQPPHSRITFSDMQSQTISFYQSGTKLFMVKGSTTTLTDKLRFIGFSYPRSDDPTILSVALTTERSIYQGRSKALELSIEKVRVMN